MRKWKNKQKGYKMSLKKIENPERILNLIVEQHGIEAIRNFIIEYNKGQRKKQIRVNTYDDIAFKVYSLMFKDGYSKTRAINKISNHNLVDFTIRNHCAKFDKEAKEANYYSFGVAVDEKYKDDTNNLPRYNTEYMLYETINELADENNIPRKNAKAYYYKYKTCRKRDIPKDINSKLFYGGFIDESSIPF